MSNDHKYEILKADAINQTEIICRIEEHVLKFLESATLGKVYTMRPRLVKKIHTRLEPRQLLGISNPEINKELSLKQLRKIANRLMIIVEIYKNIIQRCSSVQTSITLRQLYYMTNPASWNSQKDSDNHIMDVCNLLRATRKDLGITEVPRGQFFFGLEAKLHSVTQNVLTNELIEEISDFYPRCILAVEKEGVFLWLAENKFTKLVPSIIVCAKGFPDFNTRTFVVELSKRLKVPVFGLVDYNPSGINILLSYVIGSFSGGVMGLNYDCVDAYWLGMISPWFNIFAMSSNICQPLTLRDRRFLSTLRANKIFHSNKDFLDELDTMDKLGVKVELQNIFLESGNYHNHINMLAKLLITKNGIQLS